MASTSTLVATVALLPAIFGRYCSAIGPPVEPPGSCRYLPANRTMTCSQQPAFEIIAPPEEPSRESFSAWWDAITSWRSKTQKQLGLPSRWYDDKRLQWAATSFLQPQAMLHDRLLFNSSLERGGGEGWTIDLYLDDLDTRYGGIDSVLLWHSYPNIGLDSRNQFDMLASLPGGLTAVKSRVVDAFHARGVKVLLPYNPWDQGTRNTGAPDYQTMVHYVVTVGADGFNGDTMNGINASFMEMAASLDHPLSLEPESGLRDLTYLAHDVSTWGYWDTSGLNSTSLAPPVSAYKILENRHMVHISDRWGGGDGVPRTDGMHFAYFNGVGYETWENVWGLFNQISDRDAYLLQTGWAVLRHFGARLINAAASDGVSWVPHAPIVSDQLGSTANPAAPLAVFASQFEGPKEALWLLVNRNSSLSTDGWAHSAACSPQAWPCTTVELDVPHKPGVTHRFYDAYRGVEATMTSSGAVQLVIEPGGLGAVLRLDGPPDSATAAFLSEQRNRTASTASLAAMPSVSNLLSMNMEVESTVPTQTPPEGMITIPGESSWRYFDNGNMIEGDAMRAILDIVYPWEAGPGGSGKAGRTHTSVLNVPPFHIGRTPVTKREYAQWLQTTTWKPKSSQNWLSDWAVPGMKPKPGTEEQPVVWISRADAKAYCEARGQRLPHSVEWQLAAQGTDGRKWPWGNTFNASNVPPLCVGCRSMPRLADVGDHPGGASPYGVLDMVGNVYQWTDRFVDARTAKSVLRGASAYVPEPMRPDEPADPTGLKHTKGNWYFPHPMVCLDTSSPATGTLWWRNCPNNMGPLMQHNLFLELSDSMDRSSAIGFRCARDMVESNCTSPWNPPGPCPQDETHMA